MATPRAPHPHFDDRGTLHWHTRWKSALAQAQAEDKGIFVEVGRLQCSQCRTLVQGIVPRPEIAELLRSRYVALAADADDMEPEVEELASKLSDAYMLPFVLLADAQGRYVDGSSGMVDPRRLAESLERAAQA
jgi:hypothetical protein